MGRGSVYSVSSLLEEPRPEEDPRPEEEPLPDEASAPREEPSPSPRPEPRFGSESSRPSPPLCEPLEP